MTSKISTFVLNRIGNSIWVWMEQHKDESVFWERERESKRARERV